MNKQILQKIGLHPFVAFGMIVVDMMLFGSDATGIGWVFSCAVGMILIIPCVLLQKFAYKDDWISALAKGVIIGVITAIPTPLPAILTGVGGVMGFIGMGKIP
jgi:hypothetical protein